MRALIRQEVEVAAPAGAVWDYVTDWERQDEWIPLTRVEAVDSADTVGGRIRAWSGIGLVGFWDTMTITAWNVVTDGAAECEVLHTGAVIRGDGRFAIRPLGPRTCTFVWSERVDIPGGRLGAAAWSVAGPMTHRLVARWLRRMASRVEAAHAAG